jgi:hypothetical protein
MLRMFRARNRRVMGALRVMAFFSVLGGIGMVFSLRTARAQIERRTQDVGQKLLSQLGPLALDEPQRVRINGQDMFIASTVTYLAPQDVTGRLQSYCREHSGGLAQAIGRLPARVDGVALSEEIRDPSRWMTVASDPRNTELTQIMCFARDDQGTLKGFIERLDGFMTSGDLSLLGNMRYAIARRTEAGKTHVLATWTEGHFNIQAMFPSTGDAPGKDSPHAPRPPESVRLLSAEIAGHPYALRLYESSQEPERVLSFYDRAMKERGFSRESVWLEHEDDERATSTPTYARAFAKDGGLLLVSALTEPTQGKSTQVAVIELGGTGRVRFLD